MLRSILLASLLVLLASSAFAATGYEVTSTDGEKTVTYMVNFGRGMMFDQYTAYDPASKKFVYLSWKLAGPGRVAGAAAAQEEGKMKAPKPVCSIWDHATGRTIDLYQFPGVKHPLPVIPSIEAMKVCPKTGDKNFKYRAVLAID